MTKQIKQFTIDNANLWFKYISFRYILPKLCLYRGGSRDLTDRVLPKNCCPPWLVDEENFSILSPQKTFFMHISKHRNKEKRALNLFLD